MSCVFAYGLRLLRVLLWSAAVIERSVRWSRVAGGGVTVVVGCRWWRRGGRRLLLEMGGVKLG